MNLRLSRAAGTWLCLALWAAATAACFKPKRVQPLSEAVRIYNDGVRWQRFRAAADLVPAPARDDFLDHRDQLAEDLRITGYEVVRVRSDHTGRRARVHVKFTWYLDSRGVVHQTHTVQTWVRTGTTWSRTKERHLRGEPMPGVEPDDEVPSAEDPGAGSDEPLDPGASDVDDVLRPPIE